MDDKLCAFISEGMNKYKEASRLMVLFGKSIEKELQDILSARVNWGNFHPDTTKKKRSTTFWHQYPLLNADIFGTINGKACTIRIAVNWYKFDDEYPCYTVNCENGDFESLTGLLNIYESSTEQIFALDKNLCFKPNPNDFNLERDMNVLLDELVKIAFS